MLRSIVNNIFTFFYKPLQKWGWQKFRENLSDAERQEMQKRISLAEDRYNYARQTGIDILRLYLQTVITMIVIPMIFQLNLRNVFGEGIRDIYLSWMCLLISIVSGFLSYFCIFEGNYHLSHFYYFIYLRPFYTSEEGVQNQLEIEVNRNQIRSHIFLELSHWFGIVAIILFCIAMFYILKAVMALK